MKLNEDQKRSLMRLLDLCIKEDETTRNYLLRKWRRNEDYWNDIQFFFWDESVRDYRLPPQEVWEEMPKCFNITKAHGESIIAALSTGIPFVRFFPQDSDQPDDVSASKVWSNTSELIEKQNKAQILFMKALHILYLQDFVAAYNYNEQSEEYGMVDTHEEEMQTVDEDKLICADCGTEVDPEIGGMGGMDKCPACGSINEPEHITGSREVPVVVKIGQQARKREIIDVFGPTYIKIPLKARTQKDCGYLIHSCEQNYAQVMDKYQDAEIPTGTAITSEDQIARQRTDWYEDNLNNLTVHRVWFRPWLFWLLNNKDEAKALRKQFPDGIKCIFAESSKGSYIYLDSEKENLDARWTISVSGTSTYLHSNPGCQSLIPIQDMTNKMRNLEIETIEHGIPITFVSPQVIDFDDFRNNEARPGDLYPTEDNPGGRAIGEHFYSTQPASLSKEVQFFDGQLEKDGQFVLGDYPSVYGGATEGGGGTAYEYETSKNQATQRLGLIWKNVNNWWADVMGKAVRSFLNNMVADESFVKQQNDTYTTIWIKKSLANVGRIGQIEPEVSENFPVSSGQQRALLLELLQLQSDPINSVIFSPDNSQFISQTLGYPKIKIPGQNQRAKQQWEIQDLIKGSPTELPPSMPEMGGGNGAVSSSSAGSLMASSLQPQGIGMQPQEPQMLSSVPIEPDIDDDAIHAEVLIDFLSGEICQSPESGLKYSNPAAYMNCVAHLKEHLQNQKQKMMEQAMMNPAPSPNKEPVAANQ